MGKNAGLLVAMDNTEIDGFESLKGRFMYSYVDAHSA